jgi:localization factor PodJL
MMRQNGHGESLLAPLDAMATELRIALKAHDPQAAAAGLEREIRAIGDKIDALAATAINPETFERIKQQTEEVRDLLASAALRTAPLERMERQIGELADRVERLGASPAPHAESAQMAALLAQARNEIERSTPPEALQSIERRLEQIAARLDQEIARPAAAPAIDPRPFDELARRIDDVRKSVESRAPLLVDTSPVERILRDFGAKLDAPRHSDVDARAVQTMFAEIGSKLDRLSDGEMLRASRVDAKALVEQISNIHDRIDALAAKTVQTDESEPAGRELLERLRDVGARASAAASETSAAMHTALAAHLSELKTEQASADRRTQARLAGLQEVLETLVLRIASIESELAGDIDDELRPPGRLTNPKTSATFALPGLEALEPEIAPQRLAQPKIVADDSSSAPALSGEDILLEPGAGAQQRARELAPAIGPKTNPAISAHIAAARRAAQAALAEKGGAAINGSKGSVASAQAQLASLGVENVRAFYASHKRSVLLGVALAIIATLAVRVVGVRAPFLQRSELGGQPVKTAKVDAPLDKPFDLAGAIRPTGRAIDAAPTGSIAPPPAKPDAPDVPQAVPPLEDGLLTAIPPDIPQPLRDAVSASVPDAEYELAVRLFEGRGVPKDQQAAARWFERAASHGLAPAQYRLGALYEKGIGLARDPAAAKRWYLKAAEVGNARAAYNLAVMDAEPANEKPDYGEAVKWFRKAGELGVRDGQYNLAILYARGLGVEQDLRQSWLWFSLAAQQGDADAAKKRDEVAAKMDPASLAAAADALAKFKPVKPDPTANDVAAPQGGWDGKTASSP